MHSNQERRWWFVISSKVNISVIMFTSLHICCWKSYLHQIKDCLFFRQPCFQKSWDRCKTWLETECGDLKNTETQFLSQNSPNKHIKCWSWETFIVFENKILILNLIPATWGLDWKSCEMLKHFTNNEVKWQQISDMIGSGHPQRQGFSEVKMCLIIIIIK